MSKKKLPKQGNPVAVAHSKRGGAGAGHHKDKQRGEQLPRKKKHKKRLLDS